MTPEAMKLLRELIKVGPMGEHYFPRDSAELNELIEGGLVTRIVVWGERGYVAATGAGLLESLRAKNADRKARERRAGAIAAQVIDDVRRR